MTQDEKHALYIAWLMGAPVEYRWTDGRLGPNDWILYSKPSIAHIADSAIYWWVYDMHAADTELEFRIAPKEDT